MWALLDMMLIISKKNMISMHNNSSKNLYCNVRLGRNRSVYDYRKEEFN